MKPINFFFAVALLVSAFLLVASRADTFASGLDAGDGAFHFARAVGNCDLEFPDRESCTTYPPLYHFLAGLFVKQPIDLVFFNVFIVFGLGSMLFFYLTKSIWGAIFYLSTSTFTIHVMSNAVVPSVLAIFIFLIFLYHPSLKFRVPLFLLGIATHNYFFVLVLIGLISEFVSKNFQNGKFFAWIPLYDPTTFLREVSGTFNNLVFSNYLFVSLLGFFELVRLKKLDFALLVLFSFITSLDISRSFFLAQLITLIGFTKLFERSSTRHRLVFCSAIVFLNVVQV